MSANRPLFKGASSFTLACEEAFNLIDKNGDGVLSRIE